MCLTNLQNLTMNFIMRCSCKKSLNFRVSEENHILDKEQQIAAEVHSKYDKISKMVMVPYSEEALHAGEMLIIMNIDHIRSHLLCTPDPLPCSTSPFY